jgi:tRNA(Arg) A34 adenosine deaminase TadA
MDEKLLKRAIELAEKNIEKGGGPFGAIIVKDGEIIAEESNRVTPEIDPTAHAEILAIRSAAKKLGTWHLEGCELYTSCEPCPMCLGAVYWAHIDKVYYAATHDDAKDAGFDDADMYNEMKLPRQQRKIPMESAFRKESLKVFRKWKDTEEKKSY